MPFTIGHFPKERLDSNQVKLLKSNDTLRNKFGSSVKIGYVVIITFELDILLKKQELKPGFKLFARGGWGGWIRTNECRHQKPMPYHLATPQRLLW